MKVEYPGIIHNDPDGYWIEFPDLPGCATEGDTFDELMENAEEALGAYLASVIENGIEVKKPSRIEDIDAGENLKVRIEVGRWDNGECF